MKLLIYLLYEFVKYVRESIIENFSYRYLTIRYIYFLSYDILSCNNSFYLSVLIKKMLIFSIYILMKRTESIIHTHDSFIIKIMLYLRNVM